MKKLGTPITDWLNENKNPEIDRFLAKNLAITEKVRLALNEKGWKAKDLAEAMGKSPSEVSKWLSGTHNLTLKSIIKMETALDITLMHTVPVKAYEYVYLGMVKSNEDYAKKKTKYQESGETNSFEIAM